ncbi:hypothetical protein [Azohydromonas aeria]|uniref:hypothetical protein n=1 Tax=Azohydromonas aeria TaxID=2590212 RepID=UPI0012F7D820|nr:hypothetical protein [Azohydromonas aeria]
MKKTMATTAAIASLLCAYPFDQAMAQIGGAGPNLSQSPPLSIPGHASVGIGSSSPKPPSPLLGNIPSNAIEKTGGIDIALGRLDYYSALEKENGELKTLVKQQQELIAALEQRISRLEKRK